jgi:RimJ/RimL family protein N-acetyltransferase
VILETQRLRLRELTLDDIGHVHSIIGDPVAMQWFPKVYSLDEAREWVERQLRRYAVVGCGLWGCELKSSSEFIGMCGPTWQPVDDVWQLEIGYMFVRAHWGHGYAREAARACMDWAFNHYAVTRLISLIRAENEPSWRVAQRNGMTRGPETLFHDLPHEVWEKKRAEWESAAASPRVNA